MPLAGSLSLRLRYRSSVCAMVVNSAPENIIAS